MAISKRHLKIDNFESDRSAVDRLRRRAFGGSHQNGPCPKIVFFLCFFREYRVFSVFFLCFFRNVAYPMFYVLRAPNDVILFKIARTRRETSIAEVLVVVLDYWYIS